MASNAGDGIKVENAAWSFGGDVVKHFDEHVSRSVPLYHEGHDLICKLSDYFIKPGSICYDLGCSTGTLTHKLARYNSEKTNATFIGIEMVREMLEQADHNYQSDNVEWLCEDILQYEYAPSDLIVSYCTIQFVRPSQRQILFDKLYRSLQWGGGLILYEKVRAPDARFQDMMTSIYTEEKIDAGYSSEEIIAKSRSLKGILEPFSTEGNYSMLNRAGFEDIITVMKYVCFEMFLAIK